MLFYTNMRLILCKRGIFMKITYALYILLVSSSMICAQTLVHLKSLDSSFIVELPYASAQNFTGQVVYPKNADAYLLEEPAHALCRVQKELKQIGLGLKIWDAFRPMSAQEQFWHICPDERYVAPPQKGGRHTRGTTVDVTLVYLTSGEELEMPTEFDNFTEKAHRDSDACLETARENRDLLQRVMEEEGFIGLPTEWWHFDYKGWQNEPPIDINFDVLQKQ